MEEGVRKVKVFMGLIAGVPIYAEVEWSSQDLMEHQIAVVTAVLADMAKAHAGPTMAEVAPQGSVGD